MVHAFKWLGTILQLTGSTMVALHLPWSGWGFPVMLAGSIVWAAIALAHKEWALATLNLVFSAINIVGIWRWLG
jgi:nicotinamide riboside transporter PnuC